MDLTVNQASPDYGGSNPLLPTTIHFPLANAYAFIRMPNGKLESVLVYDPDMPERTWRNDDGWYRRSLLG